MLGRTILPMYAATALLSLAPTVFAKNSHAIPCAVGSGTENGCSFCEPDKAIEVASWDQATSSPHFDLPTAGAKSGGGYDVWWNIEQPGDGCRVLLFEPHNTDRGSIDPKIPGNVILSVNHGGCYFGHVGSRGVFAGACCWNDCVTAGAVPAKKKRSLPLSRAMQSVQVPGVEQPDTRSVKARDWRNPNPWDPKPEAPKAGVTCSKPEPNGGTYTKAGKQQVNGQTLNCNGGAQCDRTITMSVAASTSLSNEKSTTHTQSNGVSVSMTAGYMLVGTATVTAGYNHDWAKAVAESMGTTETNTITKSLTLSIGLVPGVDFNGWFTPTLKCQSFKIKCNDAKQPIEQSIEKCEPVLDDEGNPFGDHGVMAIGS